jgi:hypothetical protein
MNQGFIHCSIDFERQLGGASGGADFVVCIFA